MDDVRAACFTLDGDRFRDTASINQVTSDQIRLCDVRFQDLFSADGLHVPECDLESCRFGSDASVRFDENQKESSLKLTGVFFKGDADLCDVGSLSLQGAEFSGNLYLVGCNPLVTSYRNVVIRGSIFDNDPLDENTIDASADIDDRLQFLHDLELKYRAARRFDEADRLHVACKREHGRKLRESDPEGPLWNRFALSAEGFLSAYGTSWTRVLCVFLLVTLVSGAFYEVVYSVVPGQISFTEPDSPYSWFAGWYLSLLSGLTIGFGDVVPVSDPMRIVVCVQGAACFILLTYMCAIIVHRATR